MHKQVLKVIDKVKSNKESVGKTTTGSEPNEIEIYSKPLFGSTKKEINKDETTNSNYSSQKTDGIK